MNQTANSVSPTRRSQMQDPEAGLMLLAVVVMVVLVLIALAVAAPVVARDLRRDKEVESEHRAQQYDRAIRLFYRATKSYPGSMEALEKTNNVRFLRQKYVDPLTGKNDWRIIHVGQNQTTVKGFFGQPLAGIASSGLGSAAGLQSSTGPGTGPGAGGSSGTTGTSINTGCSASNSAFCQQAPTTSTSGGTTATGTGATGTSATGTSSSDSSNPLSGGGGLIMGVGTARTGDSILTPNEQDTYETWEFLYDPLIEKLYASANILGGGGIGSQSASSFGKDATSGQSDSGSGSSTSTGGATGNGGGGLAPGGGATSKVPQ